MSAKYVRKGADDDETPGLSGRRERSSVNSCRSKQPKRTLRLFGAARVVARCAAFRPRVLDTGKRERCLLVETKIGAAGIDTDQLADYCRLAKANKVDAIVTVSNE